LHYCLSSEDRQRLQIEAATLHDVEHDEARVGILASDVAEPVRTVVERRELEPPLRAPRARVAAGRLDHQMVIVSRDEDVRRADRLPAVLLPRPPLDRLTRTELVTVHDPQTGA